MGRPIYIAWLATLLVATAPAWAAEWKPMKRIEVVVPNAPGGGNDRLVRLVLKIAQEQRLIEPVVNVIHKPGAGVVMKSVMTELGLIKP